MTPKKYFFEIWDRIKTETDISTFSQLAEIVETTHQYVSRKKAKDEFPVSWAYVIERKYGLLTGWIMTGQGPKRLDEQKGDLGFYEELEEWARETGQSKNTQWMRNQIESFFPMFKEWKKRRDEGGENNSGIPSSKVA